MKYLISIKKISYFMYLHIYSFIYIKRNSAYLCKHRILNVSDFWTTRSLY